MSTFLAILGTLYAMPFICLLIIIMIMIVIAIFIYGLVSMFTDIRNRKKESDKSK